MSSSRWALLRSEKQEQCFVEVESRSAFCSVSILTAALTHRTAAAAGPRFPLLDRPSSCKTTPIRPRIWNTRPRRAEVQNSSRFLFESDSISVFENRLWIFSFARFFKQIDPHNYQLLLVQNRISYRTVKLNWVLHFSAHKLCAVHFGSDFPLLAVQT